MPRLPAGLLILLGLLWLAGGPALEARDFKDAEIAHIAYPGWFKDSFLDMKEDLDQAQGAGKLGLMVLFTTEGCSYCDKFIHSSLGDPQLAALVQEHFDAIGLEIFNDAEMVDPRGDHLRVKEFAKREGAGFSPTLLFYGGDGALLHRAVGYLSPERFRLALDYLIDGEYQSASFRDYVIAREAAAAPVQTDYELREDTLFGRSPYALDRSRFAADRPLLVIFEAGGCAECPVLHEEVLALPEVRELLERFQVVRLDARDTTTPVLAPDGRRTSPAQWYAQTGFSRLPALLFFEESGKQVLGTDALVLRQRMMNSLLYTLERAYERDWTYQRFARSKGMERARQVSQ
jgi:thioredoxin-related protein